MVYLWSVIHLFAYVINLPHRHVQIFNTNQPHDLTTTHQAIYGKAERSSGMLA